MGRGTIDWKSVDSYNRLLAAMVAAQDLKPNYKKIADMYGEGATYDSIEGRFRIIRKEAEKLKTEIENGVRNPAPPRGTGTGSKNNSPKKARGAQNNSFVDADGVLSGRISKNNTPTKRRSATQIKKELLETSTSTSSSGEHGNGSSSNGNGDDNSNAINLDDDFVHNFDASTAAMSFQPPGMYEAGGVASDMDNGTHIGDVNLDMLGHYFDTTDAV